MPVRYLALCNPGGAPLGRHQIDGIASATGLHPVLIESNLLVLADGVEALTFLEGGGGMLLGRLFDRDGAGLSAMSSARQAAIRQSHGASLIAHHWGQYIAILRDDRDDAVHILRDPSAGLPCYYVHRPGLIVVSSDVEALIHAGVYRPAIDWTHVAAHLVADQLRPSHSCLAGVHELLGGMRLSVRAGQAQLTQLWSPWQFADQATQIPTEPEAARALANVVRQSVGGCASVCRHIVLGVSGGLDSSIIAACLAEGNIPFTCLTLVTNNPLGDERPYARAIARAVGAQLVETDEIVSQVDISRSSAAHLPRPIARAFAQTGDRAHQAVAGHVGADAYFSGTGGDNVFCYMRSASPIADRLLVEGPGIGMLKTAADMSVLAECSLWTAVTAGMGRAWFRRAAYRWPTDTLFLTRGVLECSSAVRIHPWLAVPRGGLPGKAAHIAWLMSIQNHLEGFPRERRHPIFYPLMAQPVVELCLRIPTWMWCAGGRNRSVARTAFADVLPSQIVKRTSKGSPGSFVVEIFEQNRARIGRMLCDGLLARQGLLDVAALRRLLADPRPPGGVTYSRIMALVDFEAWVQSWAARSA